MSNEQNNPFYQLPINFSMPPRPFMPIFQNSIQSPRFPFFPQPQQVNYHVTAHTANFDYEFICKQREDLFKMVSCFFNREDQIEAPLWPSDFEKNAEKEKCIQKELKKKEDLITITFYKEGVERLNRIISELKENLAKIKIRNELSEEVVSNTERLKKEYRELYNILNDEKNLKQVIKKINKRKAKRQRYRKNRTLLSQQKSIREKEIVERHVEIDDKLKKMQEKIKADKEAEKNKKCMDETLQQVRRRINDTKMMLDYMSSLRKLRVIRRQHARDKSQYPREHDSGEKEFLDEINQLESIIQKQKAAYENERRKLIATMDSENAKRIKRQKEIEKQFFEKILNEGEKELRDLFFGPEDDEIYEESSSYLSKLFHLQSKQSLQGLFSIRQQWDKFLVSNEVPNASGVQPMWINPSEPTNSSWEKYLVKLD